MWNIGRCQQAVAWSYQRSASQASSMALISAVVLPARHCRCGLLPSSATGCTGSSSGRASRLARGPPTKTWLSAAGPQTPRAGRTWQRWCSSCRCCLRQRAGPSPAPAHTCPMQTCPALDGRMQRGPGSDQPQPLFSSLQDNKGCVGPWSLPGVVVSSGAHRDCACLRANGARCQRRVVQEPWLPDFGV